MGIAVLAMAQPAQAQGTLDPAGALTFMAPWSGQTQADAATFDPSLLDDLQARICLLRTGQCETINDSTSRSRLRLEPLAYVVSWRPPLVLTSARFSVNVELRPEGTQPAVPLGTRYLDIGAVGALLGPTTPGIPRIISTGLFDIRLLLDLARHPAIRARQLALGGVAPAEAVQALVGEFATLRGAELAQVLTTYYGLAPAGVADALLDAGIGLSDVAVALRDGLALGFPEVTEALIEAGELGTGDGPRLAGALGAAGASLQETATTLAGSSLGLSPAQLAAALVDGLQAGYTEVAVVFAGQLSYAEEVIAAALDGAGATIAEVARALVDGLGLDAARTVSALESGGVVTLADATAVAQALAPLGVSLADTAQALAGVLGASAAEVAQALVDGAQATFTDTAVALRDALSASAATIAGALQHAGASIAQSVDVFVNGLSLNPLETAEALVAGGAVLIADAPALAGALIDVAGATLGETATVLAEALEASARQVAAALVDGAGATYEQVADALRGSLGTTAAATADAIAAAGASLGQTLQAVGTAFGLDVLDRTIAVVDGLGLDAADAEQLVAALEDAGATLEETAQAIGAALDIGATHLVDALETAFTVAPVDAARFLLADPPAFSPTEVALALRDGLGVPVDAVAPLLLDAALTPVQVATALHDAFSLGASRIADVLSGAGVGITDIALALDAALQAPLRDIADALRRIGEAPAAIASVFDSAFDATATEVAVAFRTVFTPQATAAVLRDVFGLGVQAVADTLQDAGFVALDTALVLEEVYDLGYATAAGVLTFAGYGALDLANAGRAIFDASLADAYGVVRSVVSSVTAAVDVLEESFFGADPAEIVPVLDAAGVLSDDVVDALREVYGAGAAQVVDVMEDFYSMFSIVRSLDRYLNPVQIADAMETVGRSATDIAFYMEDVFRQEIAPELAPILSLIEATFPDEDLLAEVLETFERRTLEVYATRVLDAIGFSPGAIADALAEAYDAAAAEIAKVLHLALDLSDDALEVALGVAGFSQDVIDSAIAGAEEFFSSVGGDVEDAFCGAFGC